MAGDWIKMRGSLLTHPKVLRLTAIVASSTEVGRRLSTGFNGTLSEIVTRDVTRDVVIASLLRVWSATNEHTDDGVWREMTIDDLDQVAGVPGFGCALAEVGWALADEHARTVEMPNFLIHNAPAKGGSRSTAAERQRRYRERKAAEQGENCSDVTRDGDVTRDVTSNAREEKRREERRTPPTPTADAAAGRAASVQASPAQSRATTPSRFDAFWAVYPRRVSRARAEKAWAKLRPDDALVDRIVQAAQRASRRDRWKAEDGRYVPHPATWLNDRGWEDEDLQPSHVNGSVPWWVAAGHGTREQAEAAGEVAP